VAEGAGEDGKGLKATGGTDFADLEAGGLEQGAGSVQSDAVDVLAEAGAHALAEDAAEMAFADAAGFGNVIDLKGVGKMGVDVAVDLFDQRQAEFVVQLWGRGSIDLVRFQAVQEQGEPVWHFILAGGIGGQKGAQEVFY